MKILMVCLGNICRSPLAEGILQHKADAAGLLWKVDSAGTADYHVGKAPHHLSQKVARVNGIDIGCQQCRLFKQEDMYLFDKIYAMDSENYINIKQISGSSWDESKVDLLLNELYPGRNMAVPDPWFGTEDGYHKVYQLINDACDCIIKKYAPYRNQQATPITAN